MKDVILVSLIVLAEAGNETEHDVTLIVGGFLVSGYVISYKKYLEHHGTTKSIGLSLDKIIESEPSPPEKTYNFIHLRDAKYFVPGNQPIPANMGIFVRIPLESVHGFSFGVLQSENK